MSWNTEKTIMVGVLLKAGQWLVWPIKVFDDGFGGSTWSERIGISAIGIEAKFMKKSKSGRLLYRQV